MTDKKDLDGATLSVLLASLKDAQDAIRAYDTKAQIVSIGFIFSLGMVATVGALAPDKPPFTLVTVILSWLLGVLPVMLFGYVLYPSRSMAPKLGTKIENLRRTYYVTEKCFPTLDEYLDEFDQSDWKVELAYEIQKNSLLRDKKRNRFVTALVVAGISFSLMFLAQLLRSVGALA